MGPIVYLIIGFILSSVFLRINKNFYKDDDIILVTSAFIAGMLMWPIALVLLGVYLTVGFIGKYVSWIISK